MKVLFLDAPYKGNVELTKNTINYLKKNKIKFKDIDVSSNDKHVQEMISKSHQTGVPVIDINGSIVVGFEESKLKALLKIK